MKVIFKLSSEYLAIRNDLFIKNEQTCPEINLDNLNKIVIMLSSYNDVCCSLSVLINCWSLEIVDPISVIKLVFVLICCTCI